MLLLCGTSPSSTPHLTVQSGEVSLSPRTYIWPKVFPAFEEAFAKEVVQ